MTTNRFATWGWWRRYLWRFVESSAFIWCGYAAATGFTGAKVAVILAFLLLGAILDPTGEQ